MNNDYIFQKEVDWSLLHEGLTIKLENQVVFKEVAGRTLKKGDKHTINLELYGKTYQVKLTNVDFNEKYNRHGEIIQIRYSPNSELAIALRGLFSYSYEYIKTIRNARSKEDHSYIKVPDGSKEYLCLFTTEYDDTYSLEAITNYDLKIVSESVGKTDEQVAETIISYEEDDPSARVEETVSVKKIRRLNRSIGNNLKLLYEYRCQICGQLIGEKYGTHIAEAHHIDYFINSHNNDASNILIVCANHHRIIHSTNPMFDRNRKLFKYDNGYQEGLILNKHIL